MFSVHFLNLIFESNSLARSYYRKIVKNSLELIDKASGQFKYTQK